MILKDLNLNDLTRLASQQVEHVTCIECCKYYVVPTTATCGHTLCHSCWRGRHTCPFCSIQFEKRNLKLNLPLQLLTDHIQVLGNTFEELFKIKLDEFSPDEESEDPIKQVKEWLTSSQNYFSTPVTDSQFKFSKQPCQGQSQFVEKVTSNIQIHTVNKKNATPIDVIHIAPVQVDWDKIEEMPDMEKRNKNEENSVGPMDIEPFDFVDECKEYSNNNPRRSSRHKENKCNFNIPESDGNSDKRSHQNSNLDSDNKSHKLGKNWNNVKRMKKEFSKLNKKNRNKLNVSIEMCKKNQIVPKAGVLNSQQILYDIDDNTPEIDTVGKAIMEDHCNNNNEAEFKDDINIAINKHSVQNLSDGQINMTKHASKAQTYVNTNESIKDASYMTKEICKTIENHDKEHSQKVSFFKKSALNKSYIKETLEGNLNNANVECIQNVNTLPENTDDIEITIKIGNTLTNIYIKKKENDVQLKINSDREVQTSLDVPNNFDVNNKKSVPFITENIEYNNKNAKNNNNGEINVTVNHSSTPKAQILEKSISTKKNTTSADTVPVQFEITESVERELTDIMDNVPISNKHKIQKSCSAATKNKSQSSVKPTQKNCQEIPEDMEYLNDLDIFDGESVKERNVKSLKASKNTPSAILMPTNKSSKLKSQNQKRDRDITNSDDLPSNKKIKLTHDNKNKTNNLVDELRNEEEAVGDHDSENINYDAIMSQVFANIDADMNNIQKRTKHTDNNENSQQNNVFITSQGSNINKSNIGNSKDVNQKCSENVFSMLEKDISDSEILETSKHKTAVQIQSHKEDSPVVVKPANGDKINIQNENSQFSQTNDIEIAELSTPIQDNDSDKSIVEETPQKISSFSKNRNNNELTICNNTQQLVKRAMKPIKKLKEGLSNRDRDNEDPNIIINLSDSLGESTKTVKNVTVVEAAQQRTTLETPLTITKFVDQIKHKSTPMARKSLNFTSQRVDNDPEQTLCPSSLVAAKTTQEKEFMRKAFDDDTQIQPSLLGKNPRKPIKLCIAGSCLSSSEQASLKLLCIQRNWMYIDKYSSDLTHLVVGVDEENKSQRSVKYMCALAGAKWIVSYEWVDRCLQTKDYVDEEQFEALDGTGEPGPRRSRLAKRKLFEGMTFFCMPPFSVLDVDTLKGILESAGARVASAAAAARAGAAPALLLAEPEHTQEDRFIYLAMELGVVPVNYEWVLNCLGSYSLSSIYELLLCPASLLPPCTNRWPSELICRDFE